MNAFKELVTPENKLSVVLAGVHARAPVGARQPPTTTTATTPSLSAGWTSRNARRLPSLSSLNKK